VRIHQESHFIPVAQGETVHARRIATGDSSPDRPAVVMVHGMVENGRVFYSPTGKGLAPFLARRGLDCWVLDLRGRGLSRPQVHRGSSWGQTDELLEDLPSVVDHIATTRGVPPELWVAHSWGGVLCASYFARFPDRAATVRGCAMFGTKRRVLVRNLHRRLQIDLIWKLAARAVVAAVGYLPARTLGWGSDDESRRTWADCVAWVRERGAWVDPVDGFDYLAAAPPTLPPTLWIAGAGDHCLGHAEDVRLFMRECGDPDGAWMLLARAAGFDRDAGHTDMLTHPKAVDEHFPLVADWLGRRL
jgi:predicted alpha/beta hydrolase